MLCTGVADDERGRSAFIPSSDTVADVVAVRFNSGPGHHPNEVETFEAFNLRYANFFNSCDDIFELQRGLNNCFAYDLVPSVEVIVAALKCARKVDDYATAVRIIEGISVKVENKGQYEAYLDELKPTLDELGESGFSSHCRQGDPSGTSRIGKRAFKPLDYHFMISVLTARRYHPERGSLWRKVPTSVQQIPLLVVKTNASIVWYTARFSLVAFPSALSRS